MITSFWISCDTSSPPSQFCFDGSPMCPHCSVVTIVNCFHCIQTIWTKIAINLHHDNYLFVLILEVKQKAQVKKSIIGISETSFHNQQAMDGDVGLVSRYVNSTYFCLYFCISVLVFLLFRLC